MRINTITCHDVYNHGASLQAHALMTYLSDLGHDAKIIDYKPNYLKSYCLWGKVSSRYNKPVFKTVYSLVKFPRRFFSFFSKRKIEFDKFTKNYLKLTRRYSSFNELKLSPPLADVYIAGSDQIWNTYFENGKDPAFYLQFAPSNSIKASYAASFSTDSVSEKLKKEVKAWLSKLDYISVREKTGLSILNNLDIKNAVNVLDPVFLLERAYWNKFADKWQNPEKEPYVLVYAFNNDKNILEYSSKIAKEKNLNIISVLDNKNFKNYYNEGPIAFLKLIKDADYIISNSFHATAFSIIFNKDFFVLNREENINTRMQDMLSLLCLSERLITCYDKVNYNKVDYEIVNDELQKQIKKSKEFIDTVLKQGVKNE